MRRKYFHVRVFFFFFFFFVFFSAFVWLRVKYTARLVDIIIEKKNGTALPSAELLYNIKHYQNVLCISNRAYLI